MQGAVYLVQPQEFVESNTFKIGMTKRNDGSRVSSYGKESEILRVVECSNPKSVEDKLIEVFKSKFSISNGKEYFNGNKEEMIKCFDECLSKDIEHVEEFKVDVESALDEIQTMIDNPSMNADDITKVSNRLYDQIGVNQSQRDRLDELSTVRGFKINADTELKFFGVIAGSGGSGQIRRIVAHQDLLPPKKPINPLCETTGLIEESPYCKVISNIKSIGVTTPRTYWLTWTGFLKALLRSTQQPHYANYFAIQSQIRTMMLRKMQQ